MQLFVRISVIYNSGYIINVADALLIQALRKE